MAVTVAVRPARLDGCFSSWNETFDPAVVRSEMSSGMVKARRRSTGITRIGQGTMRLQFDAYADFRIWYEENCEAGVHPTRFRVPPDNAESVWRFAEPPQATFYLGGVVEISMTLEQLPDWRTL